MGNNQNSQIGENGTGEPKSPPKLQEEAEKQKLETEKRKVELKILEIKKKKIKCFLRLLSILVGVFSVALIAGGIWIFCSIKEVKDNWLQMIFGSMMMVSFVILIIFLCHLLKKLVSTSDEE